MSKRIAHFVKNYAGFKTFIYDEIRSLKKFEPIVLTEMVGSFVYNPPELKVFSASQVRFFKRRSFFENVLIESEVEIIRAFMAYGGIKMWPICTQLNLPLITSFHGLDVSERPKNPIFRHRLRKLFQAGDIFLVRSESMKEDVINLGCEPEKIRVLYGGIDIDKFKFSERRKKEKDDTLRILMCGRFVEKKGFYYGIKAFYNLSKRNNDLELNIVGGGVLEKKLKSLVQKLDIGKRVHFLGAKPPSDIPMVMGESNIFLSPNVTSRKGDKEGIPNTIKEAMATGLPVVSTFHAGIPELVKNEETGFLVSEKDINALTEKLNLLIEKQDLRERMGKNGRKVIENKFNLSRQIRKLEKIYKKTTKRKIE